MPNTKYKAAIIKTGPALGLLLICFFIYLPAMQADFAVDDWHVVKDNERITDIRFIPDYFTSDVWSNTTDDLTHNFKGYNIYRPLFLIVLNLGHHLWGESATGFHSLNIFFQLRAGLCTKTSSNHNMV